MNRAAAAAAVTAALILTGAAPVHAENTNPDRCTHGEYLQLRTGMTKHRTETILDGPAPNRFGRTHIYCAITAPNQFSIAVHYTNRRIDDTYLIGAE